MKRSRYLLQAIAFFGLMVVAYSCQQKGERELPIYGQRYLNAEGDTVYHKIGEFEVTNQEGEKVTEETFEGKLYVSDFFFTNCPSVCPATTAQKLRVYERFKDNPQVVLLSHTVDPQRDSVAALKAFAEELGVESQKWHLVTAEQDYLYSLAKRYFVATEEDPDAPGGYAHSDKLMLVDRQGRVRGGYSGTDKAKVDQLMKDVEKLLN